MGFSFDKFYAVFRNGLGVIFPALARRFAQAEATRIKLLGAAQTEVDVERERALADLRRELDAQTQPGDDIDFGLLAERARFRFEHQERKRQRNIELIGMGAAFLLPEAVSDTPVDDDWIARFFANAQDVSAPELQRLWAAMLAGEVAQPGGISLRTLDVLHNVSVPEAQLFDQLRVHLCVVGEHRNLYLPATRGIAQFWSLLHDCGLLWDEEHFDSHGPEETVAFSHGELVVHAAARQRAMVGLPSVLGMYPLSPAGTSIAELSPLPASANRETLEWIRDQYSQYFIMTVEHPDGTKQSLHDFLRA